VSAATTAGQVSALGESVGIDLREALVRAVDRRGFSAEELATLLGRIMDGEGTPAQAGALLTALRMKGESVDELVGAALAMRQRMLRVASEGDVLDTCGTGGDASGSVNVTTLASIILAAVGVRVAKHGNRALSSRAGSHDVLEALGIDPAPSPELAERCLRETGICFLFAPTHHAATRAIAAVRRELAFRTLFNLLGPLTNPASPRHHLNGAFSLGACEALAQAHRALGARRALVLHASSGLDEFAPCGATHLVELDESGTLRRRDVTPADFGLGEASLAGLKGGNAETNARILRETLAGAPGAVRISALMTASAGLYVTRVVSDLRAGAALAASALDSGQAVNLLERLRQFCPAGQRGMAAPNEPG